MPPISMEFVVSQPLQDPGIDGGRRSHDRCHMILRVGVLEQADRTSFCLVRDISPTGVQVRLYTSSFRTGPTTIRVADEDFISGEIVWIQDSFAGIKFERSIDPETFLRLQQKLTPARRRSLPRIKVAAHAVVRTGGRNFPALLCDISSIGAKLRTSRALEDKRAVVLDLPDLPSLRGYVQWTHGIESGVAFEKPIPMQLMARWIDGRIKVSA